MVKKVLLLFTLMLFLFVSTSTADQLVWVPINPSFGGSSFNASWLMQQAEAQNKLGDTGYSGYSYERDPLKDFSESLNRQILSRLSSRLIQSAFGESELEPGHYEIGDYIIDIGSTDQGIKIIIQDPNTGSETKMEIPFY